MLKLILVSIRATIVIAAFTGIVFPVLLTFISQLLFPFQANGSLVRSKDGQLVGSELIGQQFFSAKYFHSRPSAAGSGYAGEASGGTNLGPCSQKLLSGKADELSTASIDESFPGIKQLSDSYAKENFLEKYEKVPVDAVTRSASGLDPHISRENALLQARRVAKARGLNLSKLTDLINNKLEGRDLGFLGEPRINVLKLNLALDGLAAEYDKPNWTGGEGGSENLEKNNEQ